MDPTRSAHATWLLAQFNSCLRQWMVQRLQSHAGSPPSASNWQGALQAPRTADPGHRTEAATRLRAPGKARGTAPSGREPVGTAQKGTPSGTGMVAQRSAQKPSAESWTAQEGPCTRQDSAGQRHEKCTVGTAHQEANTRTANLSKEAQNNMIRQVIQNCFTIICKGRIHVP